MERTGWRGRAHPSLVSTGIPDVKEDDIVTIVGRDGEEEVTFDELAGYAGTISYELFCLIGKRVPRVYYRDGEAVGAVNYLCDGQG